jgi:hypothetical protein
VDSPNNVPLLIFSQILISPSISSRADHTAFCFDSNPLCSPPFFFTASPPAIRRIRSRHFMASESGKVSTVEVASHSRTHRCKAPSLGGSFRTYISYKRMSASSKR